MMPRQIEATAACLLVKDVREAASYYADCLGFDVPEFWGEPATFAMAQRDGQTVMLARAKDGMPVHANSTDFGMFSAYFWVRDLEALHIEFAEKRADITEQPANREYGLREMHVRDRDGHLLCFGQFIEEAQ